MDNEVQQRQVQALLDARPAVDKIVNYDIDLNNWDIAALYKDALWVQRLDEPDAYEVMMGSIIVNPTRIRGLFSPCKILMAGPDTKFAQVGTTVLIHQQALANDAMKVVGGYKTYFTAESYVMAVIQHKGTEEEAKADISDKITHIF